MSDVLEGSLREVFEKERIADCRGHLDNRPIEALVGLAHLRYHVRLKRHIRQIFFREHLLRRLGLTHFLLNYRFVV